MFPCTNHNIRYTEWSVKLNKRIKFVINKYIITVFTNIKLEYRLIITMLVVQLI